MRLWVACALGVIVASSACGSSEPIPEPMDGTEATGGAAPLPPCGDNDGDGWPGYISTSCVHEKTSEDCEDGNAAIHPEAPELCNHLDDDCDEVVDEESGAPACPLSCSAPADGCEQPVEIAVEDDTACIRTSGGRVYCWGGRSADVELPVTPYLAPVPGLTDATALIGTSCAVTPERLVCWGDTPLPFEAPLEPDAVSYAWGIDLCSLSAEGVLSCGRTLLSSAEPSRTVLEPDFVRKIAGSRGRICAIADNDPDGLSGVTRCWGLTPDSPRDFFGNGNTAIAVSEDTVCAVSGEGIVRCTDDLSEYGGFGTATALAVGGWHRCAMDAAGRVVCWQGTLPNGLPPVQQIAAGGFTCVLTMDAQVLCWDAYVPDDDSASALWRAPYALTTAPRSEGRMFQTPPRGACDNPDDYLNVNLTILQTRSCLLGCENVLDTVGCLEGCLEDRPISDACFQCVRDYLDCTAAPCYPALVECAGYPPDFENLRTSESSLPETCQRDCTATRRLGQSCSNDGECLSNRCGSPSTLPLSNNEERVCRF